MAWIYYYFCKRKTNKQTKPKAWEQGHKRGMGTVETRDPMCTPTECGSKVNTQERGLRMSLVKKKQQVLTAAPFAGLVWSSQTLAPAAVGSVLILLFTGALRGEVGGLSL